MASVTKSARTPQAIKRARQAEKHRVHNASLRSRFRTALKKVLKALAIGDRDNATIAYREAVRVIDKSVSKGIVHANKAARHKSRLNRKLKPV